MTNRIARVFLMLVLASLLSGCDFQGEADRRFGDQHFKTAISLIELHKLRTGSYPETLDELQFTGDWDPMAISSVSYERTPSGYKLDLQRGWVASAQLSYPPEFWRGLGIVSSNVGGLPARPERP